MHRNLLTFSLWITVTALVTACAPGDSPGSTSIVDGGITPTPSPHTPENDRHELPSQTTQPDVPSEERLINHLKSLESRLELPQKVSWIEANPSISNAATPFTIVQEGLEVTPQTTLHLDGAEALAGTNWSQVKWYVEQPMGSTALFLPSSAFPAPVLEVNVAGSYHLELHAVDETGENTWIAWSGTVEVVPDQAIHVELLWTTPADPDESDEGPGAGSDLDLHFQQDAFAQGPDIDQDGEPDGWFDQPFDCFWFNPHPNWGSANPNVDDDPGLDRDDTDGAGPENLNLNMPEDGLYRVGVHYWNDHAYGNAFATVRIYLFGNLTYEAQDVELAHRDFWDVAYIDGLTGEVIPILNDNGDATITENYIPTDFMASP